MSDDVSGLDRVIDEVARSMTEIAATSDLRARVLARLATSREFRTPSHGSERWLWTLAPIAAAALIAIAVFVIRSSSSAPLRGRPTYNQHTIADSAAPGTAATVVNRSRTTATPDATHRDGFPDIGDAGHRSSGATRRAAVPAAAAASAIDRLAPAPLETPSIDINAMTTESIAIAPLETIAPIPVAPLAISEGGRP